ncbi:MAG: hypothetical protein K2H70_00560, partial [Bacteroidales bacterium]|nr:hypothetical protein [Bacteroidales bacterium]
MFIGIGFKDDRGVEVRPQKRVAVTATLDDCRFRTDFTSPVYRHRTPALPYRRSGGDWLCRAG